MNATPLQHPKWGRADADEVSRVLNGGRTKDARIQSEGREMAVMRAKIDATKRAVAHFVGVRTPIDVRAGSETTAAHDQSGRWQVEEAARPIPASSCA